jgi:hypothetical protein
MREHEFCNWMQTCQYKYGMAAEGRCVWNICRLENGMLKHNVEDDFDPDGMGVALNLSMNYEVGHCSPSASAVCQQCL